MLYRNIKKPSKTNKNDKNNKMTKTCNQIKMKTKNIIKINSININTKITLAFNMHEKKLRCTLYKNKIFFRWCVCV